MATDTSIGQQRAKAAFTHQMSQRRQQMMRRRRRCQQPTPPKRQQQRLRLQSLHTASSHSAPPSAVTRWMQSKRVQCIGGLLTRSRRTGPVLAGATSEAQQVQALRVLWVPTAVSRSRARHRCGCKVAGGGRRRCRCSGELACNVHCRACQSARKAASFTCCMSMT